MIERNWKGLSSSPAARLERATADNSPAEAWETQDYVFEGFQTASQLYDEGEIIAIIYLLKRSLARAKLNRGYIRRWRGLPLPLLHVLIPEPSRLVDDWNGIVGELSQELLMTPLALNRILQHVSPVKRTERIPDQIESYMFLSPECDSQLRRIFGAARKSQSLFSRLVLASDTPPNSAEPSLRLLHLLAGGSLWSEQDMLATPPAITIYPFMRGKGSTIQVAAGMTLDELYSISVGFPADGPHDLDIDGTGSCIFHIDSLSIAGFLRRHNLQCPTDWSIQGRSVNTLIPEILSGETELEDCTFIDFRCNISANEPVFVLDCRPGDTISLDVDLLEPRTVEACAARVSDIVRGWLLSAGCVRGYPFRRLHWIISTLSSHLTDWCVTMDGVLASLPLSIRRIRHTCFADNMVTSIRDYQTTIAPLDVSLTLPWNVVEVSGVELPTPVLMKIVKSIAALRGNLRIINQGGETLSPLTCFLADLLGHCWGILTRNDNLTRVFRANRDETFEEIAGIVCGLLVIHGRTPGLPVDSGEAPPIFQEGSLFLRGFYHILHAVSPLWTPDRLHRIIGGMPLPDATNPETPTSAMEEFLDSLRYVGPRGVLRRELYRHLVRVHETHRSEALLTYWLGGGGVPLGCQWLLRPTVAFSKRGLCVDTDRATLYLPAGNPQPDQSGSYEQINEIKVLQHISRKS
jgi:hypothetical protein